MKRILLQLLLLFCGGGTLHATDYYCDPVNGSMSNSGTSVSPWSTLAAVFAANKTFAAGDVIYLRNGFHGFPVVEGINTGNVSIKPQSGHFPGIKQLLVRNAAYWDISGLTVSPELVGEYYNVLTELVRIESTAANITLQHCYLYGALNITGWSASDILAKLPFGIYCDAPNSLITHNHMKNIGFGIIVSEHGTHTVVSHNVVEYCVNDGLRGLANYSKFEYNLVKDIMGVDDNHDDCFQSWSGGFGGKDIGTDTIRGIELRGNVFLSQTDPDLPYAGVDVEGIGLFDGMFNDFVIENNVIAVNSFNGIAIFGAKNTRVVNNIVADAYVRPYDPDFPGGRIPWLKFWNHKTGFPSTGNTVRNNILSDSTYHVGIGDVDHNIYSRDYTNLYVDQEGYDFHPKAGSPAINAGSSTSAPLLDIEQHSRVSTIDIGPYEYGGTGSDVTAPSAPSGLDTFRLGARGFILRWLPSTDNVAVTRYEVYIDGVLYGEAATNTLSITGLTAPTTYAVTVKARDGSGNRSAASTTRNITTIEDTQAPTVPAGVKAVSYATDGFSLSWLKSEDNELVGGYEVYRNDTLVATVTTTFAQVSGLQAGTSYEMSVKAKDIYNNVSAESVPVNVTTLSVPAYSVLTTQTPAKLIEDNTVELGMKFKSAQGGLLRKVRYYKPERETGSHTGRIWTTDGTLLASVVFTGETTAGWQEAELSTPLSIRGDTTYIVSVNANAQYHYTPKAFDGVITNGPLSSIIGSSGNGVYAPDTAAFPNNFVPGGNTNYFRDVVFTIGGHDSIAPTVPEGLYASGLPTSSFTLHWSPSTDAAGVYRYDVYRNGSLFASVTDTFVVVSGLAPETSYDVFVTARDIAGNISAPSDTLSVTTQDYVTLLTTQVPALIGTDGSYELGMKFKASQTGQVARIRFYKPELETGTHTGHIWKPSGQLLGSAVFTGESASGWQEAELAATVDILKDSVYIVSVNCNTRYGATVEGLASVITNGPLSSIAGGNGVLHNDPGTFPDITSGNNANYFRDITFLPWPSDSIAPDAPANLRATNYSNTSFTLSWDAATDNVAVTGYDVYKDGVLYTSVTVTSAEVTGLAAATDYVMTVKAKDALLNTSAASTGLKVRTSGSPAAYTVLTTQTPDVSGTDGPYEMGMKFSSSVPGVITKIRFLKASSEGTGHTGKLWSASTQTQLASVSFTAETASGWQEATLSTPYAILPDTVYVVSVNTIGGYSATPLELATAITNGPLSSVAGNNGVYGTVNSYPASSYNNTNYFRDVVFVPADTEAPTAPASLAATNITDASFTLRWQRSSDNVGVTAYEVFKNGTLYTTVYDTVAYVSGLSAETAYNMTVKARDQADNLSTAGALTVTTIANGFMSRVGKIENEAAGAIRIYPNPVSRSGGFYIDAGKLVNGAEIEILDITGRIVYRKRVDGAFRVLPVTVTLRSGIYIVRINVGNSVVAKKVVVN